MAAYADDPRLQDLLESRDRCHSWKPFDLSSREFSDWFDTESNHLWVWIGMQTDLPVEHHGSDMDAVFGSPTHAVHMPEHPWFGRVAGFSWRSLGGAETFEILAREAAFDFADVSDDPTGCWLGMLYRLFPERRAVFILDQPHSASAFRHGDRIEIAWLPWNVFLTSAKAIEKRLEKKGLSVEPTATDGGEGSSERTADSKTDSPEKRGAVVPQNLDVAKLARKIKKELPEGGTMIDIARDFTDGDEKRAQSLLRQLRGDRFKHLLE
jgi:hypothetical protein